MKPQQFIFIFLICLLACFRANGQPERDTAYYEIKTEMIDKAKVQEHEKVDSYYVHIRLKEKYHSEFNELTGNNIGNFLAVSHKDKVIHSYFPVIINNIQNGHLSLEFKEEEKAKEAIRQINRED